MKRKEALQKRKNTARMAKLSVHGVSKDFVVGGVLFRALNKVDFCVESGKIVALIGESGSGKTTLLRILSGLETDFEGSVSFDDAPLGSKNRKKIAFVFQESRLFPWLTVAQNIILDCNERLLPPEKLGRLQRIVGLLELEKYISSMPTALSGGTAQRVSVARALYRDADLILMDEPFSSSDFSRRTRLQDAFLQWHSENGATVVWVTHDIEEAFILGHKVIALHKGNLIASLDAPLNASHDRKDRAFEDAVHAAKKLLDSA